MTYNPDIHHRRSIRLKGYDYSRAGAYFVTICAQNRERLFGKIKNGEITLNDAGRIAENWYHELENKFHDIKCHEYIIMPNHVHFIIQNVRAVVGANLCVRHEAVNTIVRPVPCPNNVPPNNKKNNPTQSRVITPADNISGEHREMNERGISNEHDIPNECGVKGEHTGSLDHSGEYDVMKNSGEHTGPPLRNIIQWYKTMTTNEYIRNVKQNGWAPFPGKLWQRNYYEHIIRDETSYVKISEYIINNPLNWREDNYFDK
jgi:putative transposase